MKQNAKNNVVPKLSRALHGTSVRERFLHRLHAVALVLQGISASQVGRMFNDSPRAVAYWVKQFKERGFLGLEEEARSGRPPTLNKSNMKVLQTFVAQCRAKGVRVTGAMLAERVSEQFGIKLTIRQCERIVKRLNN
jgi:transposase